MKGYYKNEESSYLQYWYINSLYSWAMLQTLPVNNLEWMKGTSNFNEDFINEEGGKGYFLEVGVQYTEKVHKLHNDSPFLSEIMNIEKV